MTYKDIQIGELFVTGPAETLFIKVKDDLNDLRGGNSFEISTGKSLWVPDQREVSLPKQKHFMEAGQKYCWNRMSEAAQTTLANNMREASCY
jgi:hypothetical protein